MPALPPAPPRSGEGEWDDVSEQQVRLALSEAELKEMMADLGCDLKKFQVCGGADGVDAVATEDEANVVVTGIVGCAGLLPTIEAIIVPTTFTELPFFAFWHFTNATVFQYLVHSIISRYVPKLWISGSNPNHHVFKYIVQYFMPE